MKNILLGAAVASLLLVSVASIAQDDSGDYFTAGVVGDNYVICGASVPVLDLATVTVDLEQEAGFCLGGNSFFDLEEGDYDVIIEDEISLAGPSGAVRVEDAEGAVWVDNVDECFDVALTVEVPEGGAILVWVDGVVWWATGQPCGVGQTSQGTFGTISISHL